MIINDIVDDKKYKILLLKQYRVFITPEFQQEIQIKAKRVYKISLIKIIIWIIRFVTFSFLKRSVIPGKIIRIVYFNKSDPKSWTLYY